MREFGVEECDGGGMGLVIPPTPSIGPLARDAPRPRTAGFCDGVVRSVRSIRSFGLSVGVPDVNTLLIVRSGFPVFLGPRSDAAGPVGGPRLMGDDGIGPCGIRLEPRGPLGTCGMFV